MKRSIFLSCALAAAALLTGCMGYSLGGGRPAGVETVALAPVVNQSGEPAMEIQVAHAMRQRIQLDGRLKLVNDPASADATVEITLADYNLDPIAYDSTTRATPNIYRLRVTATGALRSTQTGEVLAESSNYGEATFTFAADLTSSKRDALPGAADELAKLMLDDLIEQWR